MKSYNSLPLVFLFFSFFLFHYSAASSSDVLYRACKDAADGDPNIHYNFCVSCLEENPKSHNASLKGLFKISIGLAKSNATSIKSLVSKLLTNNSLSKHAKSSLKTCSEVYSEAISDLKDAIAAFKLKDYSTTNIRISAAMDASDTCEEGFKEEGDVSPLKKEDNEFFELTAIALAFLSMFRS
ncbi:hypothetical protein SLEP1_g9016 [Rubroshorea leprosula]|uniref:Pectinesterase inhibitor domain-containing protein n=1 Tax=Rubroshorea leprosula TaxID=152421 RepID=A0AAV5ICV8_9ROSI|nr:hypothetical protein SLEP1_g9016 [Rubroshorea leprosula]